MKHRKWFLYAAGACIAYALIFPRFIGFWVSYGDTDVWVPAALAIGCAVCWTALEIAEVAFQRRPLGCSCGYSLEGVKCPECGRAVGAAASTPL